MGLKKYTPRSARADLDAVVKEYAKPTHDYRNVRPQIRRLEAYWKKNKKAPPL